MATGDLGNSGENREYGQALGQAKTSGRRFSRRRFLKMAGASALAGFPAAFGGLFYTRELESEWVEVVHRRLSLPNLPESFAGYRLVHISDLHLDNEMPTAYTDTVVRLINEQSPDLISFTGDFVTSSPERYAPRLVEILSRLRARDGIVAVLGNHDHDTDPGVVREIIRQSSIVDLHNDVLSLEREGSTMHLCGVDDIWMGRPDLDGVLRRLPGNGAAILLAHEPDFADVSSKSGRFDLQLSGHSHGGQVRLPLIGSPRLPKYAKKYPIGLYKIGGTLLYTNRGLGMLPPRVRFLCRPEITTMKLLPRRS